METVKSSVMATDMGKIFGRDYSCAESALAVALRYMKRPDDLVWAAGGFGGGLNHEDLCGFLTGSVMAIGFYAETLKVERKEAKKRCYQKVDEFWDWWAKTAPLHCSEIREGRTDFKVCYRLGKLAAVKLEDLIKG
jgi:hypothetical protein